MLAPNLLRIKPAQTAADKSAYYLALHDYVCSIPDGHLSPSADDASLPIAHAKTLVGGGFGTAVDSITIKPQTPHYGGPVVVLVNPGTTSSGEGPPAYISRLPSGKVIGGVAPDPRVPMTVENVLAFAAGMDVELQHAVKYLSSSMSRQP